jgi:hypothetical protein
MGNSFDKMNEPNIVAVICLTKKVVLLVIITCVLCICAGCEVSDTPGTPKGYEKEKITVCEKKIAYDLLKDASVVSSETTYEYDKYGNCIKELTQYADTNRNWASLTREYDDSNRIKKSESSEPDFTNWVKLYSWKDDKHVTVETKFPGQRTSPKICKETYDDLGNIVTKDYSGGGTYSYIYDSNVNLIEVIYDSRKDKAKNYHEYLSYDEKGRKIADRYIYEDESKNSIWEYKFQEVDGALETTTVYNGEFEKQVIEEFDDRGDVVKETISYEDGVYRQYKYMYEYIEIEVLKKR